MIIEVSGRSSFQNPDECACCGGDPETEIKVIASKEKGKRVKNTESYEYAFPYCQTCVEHVAAADIAYPTALCIVGAAFVGAGYFHFYSHATDFAIAVIGFGFFAGIISYALLIIRAKSFRLPSCTCVHRAVKFIDWYGTVQTFEIISQRYAYCFMNYNYKKLRNVSHSVEQWLQSKAYIMPPCKSQSIKPINKRK